MPFVAITRLRVRAVRFLPAFLFHTFRSHRQAKNAEGSLSVSLFRDTGLTFWTRTVWRDEEAMRAFMVASPHRNAMPHLLDWCDEASLVHWTQDTAEPPSFREAHRRMLQEGRPSKVRHPSEAHQRFEIPAPQV